MGQFQRTRVQSPDNPDRLSNGNVAHIFPANLGLEAIGNPGIVQPFDALGQRPLQNNVKWELVVVGGENLGFSLSSLAERPDFFEKDLFLVWLAATGGSARGEVPAGGGLTFLNYVGEKGTKRKHTTRATFR
jgi:hypothetical protein